MGASPPYHKVRDIRPCHNGGGGAGSPPSRCLVSRPRTSKTKTYKRTFDRDTIPRPLPVIHPAWSDMQRHRKSGGYDTNNNTANLHLENSRPRHVTIALLAAGACQVEVHKVCIMFAMRFLTQGAICLPQNLPRVKLKVMHDEQSHGQGIQPKTKKCCKKKNETSDDFGLRSPRPPLKKHDPAKTCYRYRSRRKWPLHYTATPSRAGYANAKKTRRASTKENYTQTHPPKTIRPEYSTYVVPRLPTGKCLEHHEGASSTTKYTTVV